MHDFNEKTYEKACCLYNVFSKSISNNTRLTSFTSRIPFPKKCRLFQLNVHFSNFERLFQKTLWEHFLLYYIVFNLICQATFHWETLAFFWKKYGSLLAEGTANTWWILLHNDRKSRRIKKQRCYERLCCFNIFEIMNGTRQVKYFFGPTFYEQLFGVYCQGQFRVSWFVILILKWVQPFFSIKCEYGKTLYLENESFSLYESRYLESTG